VRRLYYCYVMQAIPASPPDHLWAFQTLYPPSPDQERSGEALGKIVCVRNLYNALEGAVR